ncbi:MAG: hypothetical protein GXO46_07080 [Chlorobi bacterium]|uniref:hypothetical protein n=1 Tax=Chryseobacterium sp. VD8 TaxID=3081254 RepID=UPI0024518755|nr:hypothetical protein [Chlorobiota bacterium]
MNYISWDYRGISVFKEEIIKEDSVINRDEFPSIKHFKKRGLYTQDVRSKLCNYLNNCVPIVATTLPRLNVYTLKTEYSLVYFTDGEFIFTNLLQEYIHYEDFVLPQRWYNLINAKNYINDKFELDFDKISLGKIDVFNNFKTSFDTRSAVTDAIL